MNEVFDFTSNYRKNTNRVERMKTIKEKIEVMQGYEAGKQIQYCRPIDDATEQEWHDVYEPVWNWIECDYRIKPEPKEPTYRPYESIEELVEDYEKRFNPKPYSQRPKYTMPLIWVKHKCTNRVELITVFYGNAEDNKPYFNSYTYLDGTPVGKLVEE